MDFYNCLDILWMEIFEDGQYIERSETESEIGQRARELWYIEYIGMLNCVENGGRVL